MEKDILQSKKIVELAESWKILHHNSMKKEKVFIDDFKALFVETYAMLRVLVDKSEIDKEYMPLILNAAHFAKTIGTKDDRIASAAAVLTERMLQYCVINGFAVSPLADHTSIYSLKERREVIINFNDPDTAIDAVAAMFEADII